MGLFFSVPQSSVLVIERCGKYDRAAHAGLNCVCFLLGDSVAGQMSLRLQSLEVACDCKTKDNVFVALGVSVQFQVADDLAFEAFYALEDAAAQMRAYIYDTVRLVVPGLTLDELFMSKAQVAADVKEELERHMEAFGFMIVNVLVGDLEPAAAVREAMNDINKCQREREAAVELAEAAKLQIIKGAEAQMAAKGLGGEGIARKRKAMVQGLLTSVRNFKEGFPSYTSPEILTVYEITEWMDTQRELARTPGNDVYLMKPIRPGSNDIAGHFRDALLHTAACQRNW